MARPSKPAAEVRGRVVDVRGDALAGARIVLSRDERVAALQRCVDRLLLQRPQRREAEHRSSAVFTAPSPSAQRRMRG